ncbi:MAG: Tic22 family protein, partial [Cyanobacteria bacterium J06632_22]
MLLGRTFLSRTFLNRGLPYLLTLGLLGVSGAVAPAATALPESEVVDTLSNIPVFIVATPDGGYITNRLVREAEGNQPRQEVALLNVFFSGDDAEAFLRQAQAENRQLADTAVVGWTELASLYEQAQVQSDIPLRLLFVPEV